MAVKNFREDRDIKLGPATPRAAGGGFAMGEIRTMAKDLATVRDHVASQRVPPSVSEAAGRAKGERSLAKSELVKPAPAASRPVADIQATDPRAFQRRHLPFVRVFFEAIFVVGFFGLLIFAAGYYWFVIRDTERLISEPLPSVYLRPTPIEAPKPPAEVTSPPLLLTDASEVIKLPDLIDATGLMSSFSAAQGAPLNEGALKQLVLVKASGEELAAAELTSALGAPLPPETIIEAYTVFVFGQKPSNALGLVLKVAPGTAPAFFTTILTPEWQAQLVQFAESFGPAGTPSQPADFQTATYRGQTILYSNFPDGSALDLVPFSEHRLLGVATSKEAALRLIDRALIGL